jgi:hypothetical protein
MSVAIMVITTAEILGFCAIFPNFWCCKLQARRGKSIGGKYEERGLQPNSTVSGKFCCHMVPLANTGRRMLEVVPWAGVV